MPAALDVLLEMGFSKSRAEKALVVTGNRGPEAAMEWLLVHGDDPSIDDPLPNNENFGISSPAPDLGATTTNAPAAGTSPVTNNAENEENPPQVEEENAHSAAEAKSVKCDECGKLFKSEVEIEFHAAKSGHRSFSESTEEVKPLTEEERKEQLRKLEEKIKMRRIAKEAEQKREQIEKEKARRRTGQEIIETKKRMEEEEMKRIAELRRREKMEEKLARQRVLEQIEKDKEARKLKFPNAATTSAPTPQPFASVATPPPATEQMAVKKEYTHSKLQIRLTNGEILTQEFGSKEELAAVRVFIQMHRTDGMGPFNLMTNFPKKLFTEEDMEKPLYQLGLVPTAVLILNKASVA